MQTFLPYPDFEHSAICLDNKRLGKQRVEVLQILKALSGQGAWKNHPAVKMWRSCEGSLVEYGIVICETWIAKGFKDTCLAKIKQFSCDTKKPSWLGSDKFHASHRSNLLRKDSAHYGQFGWREPNCLPYVWPV